MPVGWGSEAVGRRRCLAIASVVARSFCLTAESSGVEPTMLGEMFTSRQVGKDNMVRVLG